MSGRIARPVPQPLSLNRCFRSPLLTLSFHLAARFFKPLAVAARAPSFFDTETPRAKFAGAIVEQDVPAILPSWFVARPAEAVDPAVCNKRFRAGVDAGIGHRGTKLKTHVGPPRAHRSLSPLPEAGSTAHCARYARRSSGA